MAAITGFENSSIKSNTFSFPFLESYIASLDLNSENSEISAPAAKAFSPMPVKIITLILSSLDIALRAELILLSKEIFKALNFSGRFKYKNAHLPYRFVNKSSCSIFIFLRLLKI